MSSIALTVGIQTLPKWFYIVNTGTRLNHYFICNKRLPREKQNMTESRLEQKNANDNVVGPVMFLRSYNRIRSRFTVERKTIFIYFLSVALVCTHIRRVPDLQNRRSRAAVNYDIGIVPTQYYNKFPIVYRRRSLRSAFRLSLVKRRRIQRKPFVSNDVNVLHTLIHLTEETVHRSHENVCNAVIVFA